MKLYFTFLIGLLYLPLKAQDCYNNFNYYQYFDITLEDSVSEISSHTIALRFDSKTLVEDEKLNSDGSDLRVVDGNCNELSFFINSTSSHSENILYVALPTITNEGIQVQVYYGDINTSENKIDGASVFDFFDDFEDGIIDLEKWESIGEYSEWTEINGDMRFAGVWGNGGVFQYVAPTVNFTEKMTYDFVANASNSQVYGLGNTSDRKRLGLRYSGAPQDTLDQLSLMTDTLDGGFNPGLEPYPNIRAPKNRMNFISLTGFLDNQSNVNFSNIKNHTTQSENNDGYIIENFELQSLRPFFASLGSAISIEFVGIRKPAESIPIIQYGVEQAIVTTSTTISLSKNKVTTFPNPCTGILNLNSNDILPESVTFYNLLGEYISNMPYNPILDLTNFQNGIYLLTFSYSNGTISYGKISLRR